MLGDKTAVNKTLTIGEGLDDMLKRYNEKYPNQKINMSQVFQRALEAEIMKQTAERHRERVEIES